RVTEALPPTRSTRVCVSGNGDDPALYCRVSRTRGAGCDAPGSFARAWVARAARRGTASRDFQGRGAMLGGYTRDVPSVKARKFEQLPAPGGYISRQHGVEKKVAAGGLTGGLRVLEEQQVVDRLVLLEAVHELGEVVGDAHDLDGLVAARQRLVLREGVEH